jgi:hypothetical protein
VGPSDDAYAVVYDGQRFLVLRTRILSEILKDRDANVAREAAIYLAMKIAYGLHRANRTQQAEAFGTNLGRAREAGSPVATADAVISAVAMTARQPVAAVNTAHFEAIRRAGYELTIENWR